MTTIKLAKAINATLPEEQRLAGYHLESLAIAAFRNYEGPKVASKMLPQFIKQIPKLLLEPIRDSTGQSVHVDEYLGAKNSNARVIASHIFERISKRMDNATVAGSIEQWKALLGE